MEFMLQDSFWVLVPPIIAIGLALLTKEVYLSLLIGVFSGALFFTDFHLLNATQTVFDVMGTKVADNIDIVIFLVFLGILVALMSKSGASKTYGEWAARSIRSKRGALLSTCGLGTLIFVDDYFNCLTVGTVMRPVTDKYKITRAKLSYVIDATAAPICIIAPISSWAAAVGSSLPESSSIDGFTLFLHTIPFNLYAWLTILMMLFLIISNFDFGAMKRYEKMHAEEIEAGSKADKESVAGKGRVFDLLIPIGGLIVFCIAAMLYTGGILEGKTIAAAFADCSSARSLVLGSFFALILTFLLYIPRKIITFREFAEAIPEGFKAMVPAILILTLAWTLSGVCGEGYLNAGGYVSTLVSNSNIAVGILPAVFFLIALGLAFATGTSWGTFGILIPIAVAVFPDQIANMLVFTVAAILAGAVCGDHVSPISDTTILASTGADCDHLEHVSTQMPYALLVAGCSFVGYIIAGLSGNGWIGLIVGAVLLIGILTGMYMINQKKQKN